MGKALVTLVNPNFVYPPITPYALDILTTSLEADDFDVEVVDLTFRREDWAECLREYFAPREPLLGGVTVRAWPDSTRPIAASNAALSPHCGSVVRLSSSAAR